MLLAKRLELAAVDLAEMGAREGIEDDDTGIGRVLFGAIGEVVEPVLEEMSDEPHLAGFSGDARDGWPERSPKC